MVKQKELQCQLSEAKMAKQQIEMTEDREKMLLEKKTLLEVRLILGIGTVFDNNRSWAFYFHCKSSANNCNFNLLHSLMDP